MNKIRREFSNFDVFAIVKELNSILKGGKIANIYEVEDLLILKVNTSHGNENLIIKSDSRINLTNYEYPIPDYPSQYILSMRKHFKNRRILEVSQYNFDRIVVLTLENYGGEPWKFVIELFSKGNFILLDENSKVKIAKRYRKFRNRKVLANKPYEFPSPRGEDFLTINQQEFKDLIKNSDVEIVRILARNVNISGAASEEICLRSGINKLEIGEELSGSELDELFKAFRDIRNQLMFGEINAHIVLNEEKSEIAALPFEFESYADNEKIYYDSFNQAVDAYFSKFDAEKLKPSSDHHVKEKIKKQQKILNNQKEHLKSLEKKKDKYYAIGDAIYANFRELEELMNAVNNARIKGYGWKEISEKLELGKEQQLHGTTFFKKMDPARKKLTIQLNDDIVNLDLHKSIGENANEIYSRGKKATKKIEGTETAIEDTKKRIQKLKEEKESLDQKIDYLIQKPKKQWHEKFHWFFSSDDFLVIGGRDAGTNEVIFRKYLNVHDLVFHTDFPGSPLTLIKNPENQEIPEETIREAAKFVASFSRAWKENWGVADVFYVTSSQVSKSPPPGEYLPKGSFMITGKKNFFILR